jgi:type I restriction enzyme S subunit
MELVKTGYQETEVGLIPVDWSPTELSSVLEFGSGKDYKELSRGDIPVYGTGGIMTYVDDYLYDGNSVGIGRKGTIDKPVFLSGKFWTVDTLFYTHSFINTIPKFIYYQFCLIPWKEYNEASGVPSLNKKTLECIKIPLPPTLKEQKAIATALSDVDALIHSLEALIVKKKAIKQGAMQELLTGKTRLTGFENDMGYQPTKVGLIPVDWEVKSLKNILLETPKYGIGAAAIKYDTNYPTYLRITDIGDRGNLIERGMKSVNHPDYQNYILQTGELVFARTGASVGKSYLYNKKDGLLVYAGFLIKIKPNPETLLDSYLKEYVSTNTYWNWVLVNSMRSGQPGINSQEYGMLPIPLPPTLKEQKAIAETLSSIDQEIQALQTKKEKYQGIKQGMMQELLTGKTRLI